MTTMNLSNVGKEVWLSVSPKALISNVGKEVWLSVNPLATISQVGLEVWERTATVTRFMVLTQVGLEAWIPGPGPTNRRVFFVWLE